MVPLTPPLLHLALESLRAQVAGIDDGDPVLVLLGCWLGIETAGEPENCLKAARASASVTPRYRDVAVLGLGVSCGRTQPEAFVDGLRWLAGRKFYVPGRTPGFEADPVALLAVAIGAASIGPTEDTRWLRVLLRQAAGRTTEAWSRSLVWSAAGVLGEGTLPEISAPDVAAALASKGFHVPLVAEDARATCVNIENLTPEVAVIRLAGLRWLLRSEAAVDLRQPTAADLIRVLGSVPRALKRWRWDDVASSKKADVQRWNIQNEYHVQSLLWAILAPIFPDLVDEEYLAAKGPKHPRVDLGIPSLRMIIEVKYMRAGEAAKIVGELAEDVTLYLSGETRYDRIIAFVWDASGSNHKHDEIRHGLLTLDRVAGAVIMSRPGTWV